MARRNRNSEVATETVVTAMIASIDDATPIVAETVGRPDDIDPAEVAAAERRLDLANAANRTAAEELRAARLGLRMIEPITDAAALTAPTPKMIIAAEGMQGTVTEVAATKYNKKSVRMTGDNGRTYTLYHDGGVITHRWDDVDYKAERLQLYPMTAKDVIAKATEAEATYEQTLSAVGEAEIVLAVARLGRDANWTATNLAAVAYTPTGATGYSITMTTSSGDALAAIIAYDAESDSYHGAYIVRGQITATTQYTAYGLPTATMLAAIAYDLAHA